MVQLATFDHVKQFPPAGTPAATEFLLETLKTTLKETCRPALRDERLTPIAGGSSEATIVFLTQPDERLSLLFEGGRMCPGDFFVALSPEWIEKVPLSKEASDGKPVLHELLLKEGITCDSGGVLVHRRFQPPRLVTYFANLFTWGTTEGWRNDGVVLETDVTTPISSSHLLEQYIGDKVLMHTVAARGQVATASALAFTYEPSPLLPAEVLAGASSAARISVLDMPLSDGTTFDTLSAEEKAPLVTAVMARVEQDLNEFLEHFNITKFVVKPSGYRWQQGNGVTFHSVHNREQALADIRTLLLAMFPGDSVLVEDFIYPLLPTAVHVDYLFSRATTTPVRTQFEMEQLMQMSRTATSLPQESGVPLVDSVTQLPLVSPEVPLLRLEQPLAHRFRVICSRGVDNIPKVATIVAGAGPLSEPLGAHNTFGEPLDTFLKHWGIDDMEQRQMMHDSIECESIKLMKALMQWEESLPQELRGAVGCQTDSLGLDFILSGVGGACIPVLIEVNDHDTTIQPSRMENSHPSFRGDCVRPWLSTMIARSSDYLCRGKSVILFAESSDFLTDDLDEVLEKLGISVVLCAPQAVRTPTTKHFTGRVYFKTGTESKSEESTDVQAADIVKQIGSAKWSSSLTIGGVLSLQPSTSSLAAIVAEKMHIHGPSLSGVAKTSTPTSLYEVLSTSPKNYFVCSARDFAVPAVLVRSVMEVTDTIKALGGCPLVVGLNSRSALTSASEFSRVAMDPASVEREFTRLQATGNRVFMRPCVHGSEHIVDIAVYEGKMVFGSVSDVGHDVLKRFASRAIAMPGSLSLHEHESLCTAVLVSLRRLDLMTGVYSASCRLSARGPRVVDICVGLGSGPSVAFCRAVWGVDFVSLGMQLALGIRPHRLIWGAVPNPEKAPMHCVAVEVSNTLAASAEAFLEDVPSTTTSPPSNVNLFLIDAHMPLLSSFDKERSAKQASHTSAVEEAPRSYLVCTSNSFETARIRLLATTRVLDTVIE